MNSILNISRILPSNIEEKHDSIKIEDKYCITLIVVDYPKQIGLMEISEAMPKYMENEITFHIKKGDTLEEVKKLTNIIATGKSEIKTINKNQLDVDIVENIIEKAMNLRKSIQVDNEEIYFLAQYIHVYGKDLKEVLLKIKKVKDNLYSRGIITKLANFRQKQMYLASLLLNNVDNHVYKFTNKAVTTSILAYMFPYYSKNMIMQTGIILGYIDNNICMYDLFSNQNMNSNICILGSSGVGKSFFVKTIILRNCYIGRRQIVIDPEGEYEELIKYVGGEIINEENFNMLYIPEQFSKAHGGNTLNLKIERIISQMETINNSQFTSKESDDFKKIIKKQYEKKGITDNIESLYISRDSQEIYINKQYKSIEEFPSIKDIFEYIKKSNMLNQDILKSNLLKLFNNEIKSIKGIDKNYNNKIIMFNLKKLTTNNITKYLIMYLNRIEEEYGEKLIVYIDEIWKCIENDNEEKITSKIKEMFKTIRKNNAGIVAITQDISDLFKYKSGSFGKSILNNSYTKLFFKMEYTDTEALERLGMHDQDMYYKIKTLQKGSAIMKLGHIKFNIDIKAADFEEDLIKRGEKK